MKTILYRSRVTGRLVDAVLYDRSNDREVFEWAPGKQHYEPDGTINGMNVFTPQGRMRAVWEDWIFRNRDTGGFWVAAADGFDDDYEVVQPEDG